MLKVQKKRSDVMWDTNITKIYTLSFISLLESQLPTDIPNIPYLYRDDLYLMLWSDCGIGVVAHVPAKVLRPLGFPAFVSAERQRYPARAGSTAGAAGVSRGRERELLPGPSVPLTYC
jgi:hypothetical protein